MFGRTLAGDAVWDLQLAFAASAAQDWLAYVADEQTVQDIHEYALHNESDLALTLMLSCTTPPLSAQLLDQARSVARLVFVDDAEAQVDAWLHWSPASGDAPPYPT